MFKLFCLLLCVLVLEGCIHRQEVFLYDIGNHIYLIYEELGDTEVTITVTDCDDADGGDLEVPAEIGRLPVISIVDSAFGGCSNLTSITIPDSVTSIGRNAFSKCSSLTKITFEDNAPAVERNVFDNISDKAKIFINPGATGFGEMFAGLPVHIINNFEITSFNNSSDQFEIRFETKSDSTYTIEVTQDFLKWDEIGEVKGTGTTVRFIDPRLPTVPFKRNFFRVKEGQ